MVDAARHHAEEIVAIARHTAELEVRNAEFQAAEILSAARETRQEAEQLRVDAETFADAALARAAQIVSEAREDEARIVADQRAESKALAGTVALSQVE
ncbi:MULTISPECIES: hypothetical protein [Pseudofrankia]|uniref:hypothetical protein n=1 Tax=Pseudofrankia TaxID=2994363 RepID=UPI000234CA22|nr:MULTISPECIES: hypothetical protein [Pseudofrankia]OHV33408.1 hypothetical protein BCD49_27500 [Pseudofrankia sp. EUN1h]